jgi:hypothetical protein
MTDEDTIKLVAMMRTCNPWDDAPSQVAETLDDAADVIERLTRERDEARETGYSVSAQLEHAEFHRTGAEARIIELTRERDEAREACAINRDTHSCISADYTQTIRALEALLASFDEDRLEEIITDSIDLDWTPRTAARAIVRAMKGASDE